MKIGKKSRPAPSPRGDDTRPAKPAAPPPGSRPRRASGDAPRPSYAGPKKTDEKPRAGAQPHDQRTKTPWKPSRGNRPPPASGDSERGDQISPPPSVAPGREQYIRLRVRVNDGKLSIIDSHLVDGPLAQAQGFATGNAYEVIIGDRLLHAGALPDLGVQRSFVNPKGPPEQRGHYVTERPTYEFMARVPAHEVSRETIDRITLRLYRVKEEARADRLGSAPLIRQFAREVRPVAELVGLPASALPQAIEERGGRTPGL
jgi:hypothetical protein